MSTPRFRYMGTVPGAVGTDFTLFDTTAGNQFPANFFPNGRISHFKLNLRHIALGTLTWYRSSDRGRIWQKEASEYCLAPVAPNYYTQKDFLVEGARDWKLVWTNGGTTQAPVLTAAVVDFTALAMATFQGLNFTMDIDEATITVNFPPVLANTAAVLAYINSVLLVPATATASCIATTGAGGVLTLTNLGAGSESSLRISAGTIALATLGFTVGTNDQAIGWHVNLEATTDRARLL